MASKAVKMPLGSSRRHPDILRALAPFSTVLFLDDKVSIDDELSLQRLLAQASSALPDARSGDEWALLVRAHEGDDDGHRGVEAELRAALAQPRYRRREAELRKFIFDEQGHVARGGRLHNTGLLLWNMRSKRARALSEYWYDATLRTSAECQITFYYAHDLFRDVVITVPFRQPGVRWQMIDTWGQYRR